LDDAVLSAAAGPPNLAYDHCGHGLCGVHLLRELAFIVDAEGYAWAKNMKRLLRETCRLVSRRKRKKLNTGERSDDDRREYANPSVTAIS
jgi:hypothetical protein